MVEIWKGLAEAFAIGIGIGTPIAGVVGAYLAQRSATLKHIPKQIEKLEDRADGVDTELDGLVGQLRAGQDTIARRFIPRDDLPGLIDAHLWRHFEQGRLSHDPHRRR